MALPTSAAAGARSLVAWIIREVSHSLATSCLTLLYYGRKSGRERQGDQLAPLDERPHV